MMLKHRDPARRDALKSLRLTLGSDAPRSRRRALTVTVFGNGIGLGDRLANQARGDYPITEWCQAMYVVVWSSSYGCKTGVVSSQLLTRAPRLPLGGEAPRCE